MILGLTLHILGAVVWVGGMFFAYMVLRPAAGALEPPRRLALWRGVFERFFPWVWASMLALLLSGYGMVFLALGGFGAVGVHVHLMNGIGLRFSIEQMRFVYTFVGAVLAFMAAAGIGWMTGTTWLLAVAVVAAILYLVLKRKHGKSLGVSLLKRTLMTYRTILSFLNTRPVPVESYPRDVVIVK